VKTHTKNTVLSSIAPNIYYGFVSSKGYNQGFQGNEKISDYIVRMPLQRDIKKMAQTQTQPTNRPIRTAAASSFWRMISFFFCWRNKQTKSTQY
jgi:hypothetical protein